MGEITKVLYIEDNPVDSTLVMEQLKSAPEFELECTDSFEAGIKKLGEGSADLVLLDLDLPDAPGGLDTFIRMQEAHPQIPVVVLSSLDDEGLAVSAVKKGAQDYLVKGHVDGYVLINALRHALERRREEQFFRTVVFSSHAPMVVVNWKGVVRFVNSAAEELFGRPAETWVGRIFGYPIDPDRPETIKVKGRGRYQMNVVETELEDEVLHILDFRPHE